MTGDRGGRRYTARMSKRVYGKVVGAIIGALLLRASPLLGGLIGLLIGHAFDAGWFTQRASAPPRPAAPPRDDPYRVLGVSADADDAQIDLAYRRMMSQYHPDRLAQATLEVRTQAEARARDINAAYDRIRAMRKRRGN